MWTIHQITPKNTPHPKKTLGQAGWERDTTRDFSLKSAFPEMEKSSPQRQPRNNDHFCAAEINVISTAAVRLAVWNNVTNWRGDGARNSVGMNWHRQRHTDKLAPATTYSEK
jgi:hypothetical protein